MKPPVGVLALQGDVREHLTALAAAGAEPRPIRRVDDLTGLAGLVIPGGESTTIGKLLVRFDLFDPLREAIADGLAVYGTCAGMILLAVAVTEGDQPLLGVMDIVVRRNAFGRQNESFEVDLDIVGLDTPFHAVFIRAPWVAKAGQEVEVMATVDDHPVMVRQGHLLASAFHPELTDDPRIHRLFVEMTR